MSLSAALLATASVPRPESFSEFCRSISEEWVSAALEATGTATLRRRRLPAEQVVWLVLGIGLFRNRPIEEVVDSLDLALPGRGAVAKSAVPSARKRLGDAPMQWLFEHCADRWTQEVAPKHRWRGLSLFGIDGTSFRTADSEDNRAEFGGWTVRGKESATPIIRVVALMELRSHLVRRARLGPYSNSSEHAYAHELLSAIPDHSLTILDALYMAAAVLHTIERGGSERHWMTIAKSNTKMHVIERYGVGDELVEMAVSSEARAADPTLPKTWSARAITYQRGSKRRTIMTSLRDPKLYPANELRELYHERWEIELGYDELKTELMDSAPTLRSKTPMGVRQEVWGTLLAYNLVRLEMNRIARKIDLPPTRISFAASLALIRSEFEWSAITRSPGAIPKHLKTLEERIKRFILPERRSNRNYPRAARDFRRYPRKRVGPAK
jgi:hypothetical protein